MLINTESCDFFLLKTCSFFTLTVENLPSSTSYGPRALTTQDGTGVYHFYTDHFTKLTCDSSSCSFSSWIDLDNQQVSRRAWMNILYIPDHLAVCT